MESERPLPWEACSCIVFPHIYMENLIRPMHSILFRDDSLKPCSKIADFFDFLSKTGLGVLGGCARALTRRHPFPSCVAGPGPAGDRQRSAVPVCGASPLPVFSEFIPVLNFQFAPKLKRPRNGTTRNAREAAETDGATSVCEKNVPFVQVFALQVCSRSSLSGP